MASTIRPMSVRLVYQLLRQILQMLTQLARDDGARTSNCSFFGTSSAGPARYEPPAELGMQRDIAETTNAVHRRNPRDRICHYESA
jgi:hypothetical protein